MAFWNKKKNIEDEEAKKPSSLSEELSDEMRAITEAMEEAQSEKEAKAEERARENERMLKERQALDEKTLETAAGYVKTASEGGSAFFMLITGPVDLEPATEQGLLVEGTAYGDVSKGEEVYLYTPDNKTLKTKIVDIRTEPGVHEETVSNRRCILEIDGSDIEEVQKYTVVSNKGYELPAEGQTAPIANPRLLGLSLDFNRFVRDNEYFSTLVNAIVRSNFLTNAKMDQMKSPDGKARIGLMSLSDPDNPGKRYIPVFTDDVSINLSRDDMKESDLQKLSLSFPQLARFSTMNGNSGFVINPFGPVSIKVPEDLIKDILSNPDFAKMFPEEASRKAPGRNVPGPGGSGAPAPGPGQIQVAIGIPADDDEFRAVSSSVAKYCAGNPHIHRVGIVMKMVKGRKDVAFLGIVDCDKGRENDCFRGIFAAAKPHLIKDRKLEFMKYADAPFADDYFSKQEWVYKE